MEVKPEMRHQLGGRHQTSGSCCGFRAFEKIIYDVDQFDWAKRLDHINVGTSAQAGFTVGKLAARGQHDDGDGIVFRGGFQVVAQTVTVHVTWHHDVEHDEIRLDVLDDLVSDVGVRSFVEFIFLEIQRKPDQLTDVLLVFYD